MGGGLAFAATLTWTASVFRADLVKREPTGNLAGKPPSSRPQKSPLVISQSHKPLNINSLSRSTVWLHSCWTIASWFLQSNRLMDTTRFPLLSMHLSIWSSKICQNGTFTLWLVQWAPHDSVSPPVILITLWWVLPENLSFHFQHVFKWVTLTSRCHVHSCTAFASFALLPINIYLYSLCC